MWTKTSYIRAVALLLIFLRFNQLILGVHSFVAAENSSIEIGAVKYCPKTERKWTDDVIDVECRKTVQANHPFPVVEELIPALPEYKTCVDQMTDEMATINECCEGFKMINDKCEEDCANNCEHGECDETTNGCSCAIGFGGEWCGGTCPAGHFGLSCEHNCDCLISQECNPNYQHCKCGGSKIEAECINICKCRFNLCNPGLMGKNCSIACPEGTYGQFCSKTCQCVDENTRECLKEYGDCVCKENFYGMHCERECIGILTCQKPNVCKCELTPEQKVELVSRTRNYLIVGLLFTLMFVFCLVSLVYRYRLKSKLLKNELKNYSLRYSSDRSNVEFSNPIYSKDLLGDCTLPLSTAAPQQTKKSSLVDALKSNRLFNRMNSKSKDWLKLKTGKQANTPTLDDVSTPVKNDEKIYSAISELNVKTCAICNEPAV